MTTTQTTNNPTLSNVEQFCETHMVDVINQLEGARVILRTVLLSLCAEETGAIAYPDQMGTSRWSAATSAALDRLSNVRDTLIGMAGSPPIDWPTPHALASALDAALWEGHCTKAAVLTVDETKIATQVLIDSIDKALRECAGLDQGGGLTP